MTRKVKKGGVEPQKPLTDAQRQMVTDNIPFAMNMGKRYAALGRLRGVELDDLQQEACYGLCIAAQRFDPSCGASFRTYANNWCIKYIMMAINELYCNPENMGDVDALGDNDLPDEDDCKEEQWLKVQAMLSVLDKKEQKVVCLVYGMDYGKNTSNAPKVPKSFKEIAVGMRLKPIMVRRIYEQAMAKMMTLKHSKTYGDKG